MFLLSIITSADQSNHLSVKQSIASYIESKGCILNGILTHSKAEYNSYISPLKQPGNYDYVRDDTVQAASNLFNSEVHINAALPKPIIYKLSSGCTNRGSLQLAFVEPAHYKAIVAISNTSFVSNNDVLPEPYLN